MNPVIQRLQDLTKSDSVSLIDLIKIYEGQNPTQGPVIMALKDFAFNESPDKISESDILKILQ